MSERIERELHLNATTSAVWAAVTADGWLADEVELDLVPGGEARFRSATGEKLGWVEDVRAPSPAEDGAAHLAFWWSSDDEPATRVELQIEPVGADGARVRVLETRPLELLDLVGTPLRGLGGASYGPALVAA